MQSFMHNALQTVQTLTERHGITIAIDLTNIR